MNIILITGSGGLIGSESVEFFADKFDRVIGIDNNMRQEFFGKEASTSWNVKRLETSIDNYTPVYADIRDEKSMRTLFSQYGSDIKLVIHCAAQPSHDWAAKDPFKDFTINANGTLIMLEMSRQYCPETVFIFCSTNKVYGDTPNNLPLIEQETRWEIAESHSYFKHGIDELMSIDQTKHSVFGASKVAADVMVQEYGQYFGMKTACFRGGCLTGPKHSGTMLHGFLSYLMKCAITGEHYSVFGYNGKQVRDNIHSYDLVNMFWHFYQKPRSGEVYNAGGSRHSNCSMQEAIALAEKITGQKMNYSYCEDNRIGDHIWWISDVSKFQMHYPKWQYRYSLEDIFKQLYESLSERGQ
jgi:CDP-paratose 2-epimerase